MVMREHRLGFFRSCISVCHQQGRPFLASLDLPVERIEAVYHGFELRRESEVIHWRGEYHHIGGHKVRTKLPEIVVEYTLTVHSATVAGDAGRNLALGAIEMVHLVSGFFRTLDELSGQMIGIPVPARTSCQYYYFHFLIRFIVQQFGCLRYPDFGKQGCSGCCTDSLYEFSSVRISSTFSFNHFDRWSATSDIIQVRQQEMRVTHSSVSAN